MIGRSLLSALWRHGTRLACTSLIWVALGAMTGCGGGGPKYPPPVPVAGKVTLAGKPLESGTIRFVPTDAKKSLRGYAKVGSGGSYDAATNKAKDGLTPGEFTVYIEPEAPTGDAKSKPSTIPENYLTPASGVKIKVDKPATDLKIDFP